MNKPNVALWVTTITLLITLIGWGVTVGIYGERFSNMEETVSEIEKWKLEQIKYNEKNTIILERFTITVTLPEPR